MSTETSLVGTVAASPEETRELSVNRASNDASMLMAFFGAEVAARMNNFDGDVKQKWRLMALGSAPDVARLSDHIGKKLAIKYIACQKVEIAADGGEMIPAIRTVLYTHDMERYATVSDGVAASAAEIFGVFGMKPFGTDMVLIPQKIRTRKGYETLQLVPAMG